MTLETLIARWAAVTWIAFGLSHALQPAAWKAMVLPLRERAHGGLLIATFNFPLGVVIVLGHNVWVWDIPVIVTLVGWLTTIKSGLYLVIPSGHLRVMPTAERLERGFRIVGVVLIGLGVVVGYDAFFRQ